MIGVPEFTQASQTFKSTTMTYNFDSQKGLISDVVTEDGNGFLHGQKVKKLEDNTVNILRGTYTTCNLEEHPHFGFRFKKSRVIPDSKIVTGPAYMEIEQMPTPLGLPFGFFPNQKKNIRYPHIGIVIINENCEIGCGSTIDRGSLSNTIIGKNTYLDNQVHIAHNNKIGDNCIIAGQVGFAGSSTLGNNVMIGGQAGVSGHLKVGNNVQIGGGSGVINDIPDNTKVMGYPAKNLREFIKDNR